MHKDIKRTVDRLIQGVELEIIHPENILIPTPEWLDVDQETERALNLQHTIGLITDKCRKSLRDKK